MIISSGFCKTLKVSDLIHLSFKMFNFSLEYCGSDHLRECFVRPLLVFIANFPAFPLYPLNRGLNR